jgi:hypothetical protein
MLGTSIAGATALPPTVRTVRGTVTSPADGLSLAGGNSVVKGTQTGTSSDASGAFTGSVLDDPAVLVFSFLGYVLQEVPVSSRSVVNVSLAESAENLNEVGVTAPGIKREERSLGYAVGKVDGKDLSRIAQENLLNGPALSAAPAAKRQALPVCFYYMQDELNINSANASAAVERLEVTHFSQTDHTNSAWSKPWLIQSTGKPW